MMNLKISALEFVEEAKNGNISVEDFIGKTLEPQIKIFSTL